MERHWQVRSHNDTQVIPYKELHYDCRLTNWEPLSDITPGKLKAVFKQIKFFSKLFSTRLVAYFQIKFLEIHFSLLIKIQFLVS